MLSENQLMLPLQFPFLRATELHVFRLEAFIPLLCSVGRPDGPGQPSQDLAA